MKLNRYHLRYSLDHDETLVINTLTGAVDVFPNEMLTLMDRFHESENSDMVWSEEEQEAIQHLLTRGYLYATEEQEQDRLRQTKQFFAQSLPQMEYVICPTYTCNFRCPYCFEDHAIHEKVSIMSDDQFEAVTRAIEHFHRESGLTDGFLQLFGGEPLLPFTKEIVQKICDKAVEWDFRLTCNTNGYHLKSFVPLLKPFRDRINLTVTVDGPKEVHDTRRMMAGGQGTFDVIESGMDEALSNGLRIGVRINIDNTNISQVPALVEHYRQNGFLQRDHFTLHLAPITDYTCQSNGDNLMRGFEIVKELQDSIPGFQELFQSSRISIGSDMYRYIHSVMQLDPKLQEKAKTFVPHIVFCEAVQGRKVAFGPDNHMYACAELVGRPEYKIGDFYPHFDLKEERWNDWKNFNSLTIPQCSGCAAAPICGGGCAAQALIQNGHLKKPHCTHAGEEIFRYLDSIREELIVL